MKAYKNQSGIKTAALLLALCCLPALAGACDKGTATFERLFMDLPNEAFELGAEGLGKVERQSLIKKNESDTYTWEKKDKGDWVIHNKFASDSVFTIRRYTAKQTDYLCINTSYGANSTIECWAGAKQAALLPTTSVLSFLKAPEHFTEQALKAEYPVQIAFADNNRLSASINMWMHTGLEEKDVAYDIYYQWNPAGNGAFEMHKEKVKP